MSHGDVIFEQSYNEQQDNFQHLQPVSNHNIAHKADSIDIPLNIAELANTTQEVDLQRIGDPEQVLNVPVTTTVPKETEREIDSNLIEERQLLDLPLDLAELSRTGQPYISTEKCSPRHSDTVSALHEKSFPQLSIEM